MLKQTQMPQNGHWAHLLPYCMLCVCACVLAHLHVHYVVVSDSAVEKDPL